jgi:hypothetical protein
MATRTKIPKAAPARKPKPEPWWHGLSADTARELERMGYHCKADAMLFVTEKARFVGRNRQMLFDPLHIDRPWLREGIPFRVSRAMYDEVRVWLEASPLRP